MPFTTIYNDPYTRSVVTLPWVSWDNAFTEEELEKIVMYCEQFDLEPGSIFGNPSKEVTEAHRVSDVRFHNRNPETSWIFDRLNFVIQAANEQFYGFDLNGYEKFQYTVYTADKNSRYDWHMDTNMSANTNEMTRKLSMTMCLNDSFEGGEFHINLGKEEEPLIIPAIKGRIIMFPSFMIHRVTPVTLGTRRSLVIWVMGPKFQ
jgi:PKHD-type hydroxylase